MNAADHVGFTGTQLDMTVPQAEMVAHWLTRFGWLDHGDCVGADSQVHELARDCGLKIRIRPPVLDWKRAFCNGDEVMPVKPYISRNHDIVDFTSELIAATGEMQEVLRSGTWATVRYARKKRRMVTIVYPDGSLEFSP